MVMSAFAVEPPRSAHETRSSAGAGATPHAAQAPGVDRQLHAQDNERVYQAGGDQYIIDNRLPTPAKATNTLPRDTAAFVGRMKELDSLIANAINLTVAGETIPIVAIDGMPGVGKTTFAVRAAHQLSSAFPDGCMYVDMCAHTPGKATVEPAEALSALLSVDGVSAGEIPDHVDGRSALWRARMAYRRSILIIDNVGGYQHVEPLLPGAAGCLVLVTSRRRLTGLRARHAAMTLPLDPLSPSEAAKLFSQLTGRTPGDGQEHAVAELVRLCGCLPLAIALLAARLRPEPRWTVQALVDDLTAAQDRLAHMRAEDLEVAAAFDLSYRALPSARRRLFRRLSLSPGIDIDVYAAAALDGVELATARRHLDALYDDHLVDQPVQGRYRLHDLLGVYARALVAGDPAEQRDRATERLLDYYELAADMADRYIAPRRRSAPAEHARFPTAVPLLASADQAISWMHADLTNLLACAKHAASQGDDARLIGMSAVLGAFLRHAGHYPEAIALHRAAAEAAGRRGDQVARAATMYHIGVLLGRAGDYRAASEALAESRAIHRKLGNRTGEADVCLVAGIVRRLDSDYVVATGILDEALSRYRELHDQTGQAEVLAELAVIRWLTDEYTAATRLLEEALAVHRQAGNRQGQVGVLLGLGMVRRLRHDYPAAARAFEEADSLCRSVGNRVKLADTQFSLGMVRRLTGDYLAAGELLEESLRIYREVGNRLGEGNALRHLGILRRVAGDYADAEQALLASLTIFRGLGNRLCQAETLQELGELRRLTGGAVRAASDLFEALAIYRDVGSRTGQAEVLNYIGALLLDKGDTAAADHFGAALGLAREIRNPLEEARALEGIASCRLREDDDSQASGRLREALEIYQRIGAPEAGQVRRLLVSLNEHR